MLTIGMPVYNDKNYLEKSLESILNQTHKEFNIIISDDASTDGSDTICKKYINIDKRITYIRQPKNLGISKNMEFLLSKASTKYFMWAGDDDLYDNLFIEKLLAALKKSEDAISVFCNFSTIDENDSIIENHYNFNFSNENKTKRVINYIKNANDIFGYGIFKTEAIKNVKFPVWWWPNNKSAYNNIFPTLCYYLSKGKYIHAGGKPLFFKRVKTEKRVNHVLPGRNNAIKESVAYWIRRYNLIVFSFKQIYSAANFLFALRIFPYLFYYWFLIPSINQFKLSLNAFLKNKLKLIK